MLLLGQWKLIFKMAFPARIEKKRPHLGFLLISL